MTRKFFSLACPHCKATGFAVWENSGLALEGSRRLVSLHGAFHEERGRTTQVEYLIVCDQCDEIQPLAMPFVFASLTNSASKPSPSPIA